MTRARRHGPAMPCRSSQAFGRLGAASRLELLDRVDRRAAARAQLVGLAAHAHERAAGLLARQHVGDARRVERRLEQIDGLESARSRARSQRAQIGERPHRIAAVPAARDASRISWNSLPFGPATSDSSITAARVELGVEVDEAAALADLAAHHDLEALRGEARDVRRRSSRSSRRRAAGRCARRRGNRRYIDGTSLRCWISSICSGPELASATDVIGCEARRDSGSSPPARAACRRTARRRASRLQ